MALTLEQKEANRLVRNERDRAYRARRKLREAAEKTAKDAILAEFGPQHDEASAAAKAIEDEEKMCRDEFAHRIAALTEERDAAVAAVRERWRVANGVASAIWDRKMEAERVADLRLDTDFPDLVGSARWSAACWTPSAATPDPAP